MKSVLDNQLLHPCPDWDGMIVDAFDEEGEGSCCTCDRELLSNPRTVKNLQTIYYPTRSEVYEERLIPQLTEEDRRVFEGIDKFLTWPFPITNSERNLESQKLLDTKGKVCAKIKIDLNNEQDALL